MDSDMNAPSARSAEEFRQNRRRPWQTPRLIVSEARGAWGTPASVTERGASGTVFPYSKAVS